MVTVVVGIGGARLGKGCLLVVLGDEDLDDGLGGAEVAAVVGGGVAVAERDVGAVGMDEADGGVLSVVVGAEVPPAVAGRLGGAAGVGT